MRGCGREACGAEFGFGCRGLRQIVSELASQGGREVEGYAAVVDYFATEFVSSECGGVIGGENFQSGGPGSEVRGYPDGRAEESHAGAKHAGMDGDGAAGSAAVLSPRKRRRARRLTGKSFGAGADQDG